MPSKNKEKNQNCGYCDNTKSPEDGSGRTCINPSCFCHSKKEKIKAATEKTLEDYKDTFKELAEADHSTTERGEKTDIDAISTLKNRKI